MNNTNTHLGLDPTDAASEELYKINVIKAALLKIMYVANNKLSEQEQKRILKKRSLDATYRGILELCPNDLLGLA